MNANTTSQATITLQQQLLDGGVYRQFNISLRRGDIIGKIVYPVGYKPSERMSLPGVRVLFDSQRLYRSQPNRTIMFIAPHQVMLDIYFSGAFAHSSNMSAKGESDRLVRLLEMAVKRDAKSIPNSCGELPTDSAPAQAEPAAVPVPSNVVEPPAKENIGTRVRTELQLLTVKQLKGMAKACRLRVKSRHNRGQVLDLLVQHFLKFGSYGDMSVISSVQSLARQWYNNIA